jgi:hypothetical protein
MKGTRMTTDKKTAARRTEGTVPALIRCGACNARFRSAKELVSHLRVCPFAKVGACMIQKALDKAFQPETPNNKAEVPK